MSLVLSQQVIEPAPTHAASLTEFGGAWTRRQLESVALFLRLISSNSNSGRAGCVRAGVDGGGSGGGGGASEEAFGASERASESEQEREA